LKVYIYIYIHMCVCVYIYICLYIYICVYTYIHTYIYIYLSIYLSIHLSICIYCICIQMYTVFSDGSVCTHLVCNWTPNLVRPFAFETEVVQLIPPPVQRHNRPGRQVHEHADHHVLAVVHHRRPRRRRSARLELGVVWLCDHPRCDVV